MTTLRLDGFIGEPPNTALAVAEALAAAGGEAVTVIVNSPGGDAFEGAAILSELRDHPAPVTVSIRGIAASAASLIAMGGAEIVMDPAAVMMIHDPAALTIGPAQAHRQSAEMLEKLSLVYATAYADRSGNRVSDVLEWMAAESWLTAEEAVALGFADRIAEPVEPRPVAAFDHTVFSRAPDALVTLARAKGWAAPPPVSKRRAAWA